jgi:hypothetical protein
MKKLIFLLVFLLSISFVSAYNVGSPIPLSVRVQYDDGVSLSNVPIPCRLSMFNHDLDIFVLRNVSMTAGSYHSYSFTPSSAGSYTASIFCSYLGDSSVFWFDFNVSAVPVVSPSGGRGVSNGSGSVLQSVLPSGSILPERSRFTVNKFVDSNLKFSTQYYVNSNLASASVVKYDLLKDGSNVDSGSLTSTSVGVYVFSYDFSSLPVGDYQVALSFDGKPLIVDVVVVSRDSNLITGFVTGVDGDVAIGKIVVLLFVLLFIILAIILLFRSGRDKSNGRRPVVR